MQSKIVVDESGVAIDGANKVLLMSSLFYFRIPNKLWEKRISDLKKSGYNTVDVYFPWNYHERDIGKFDFEEDRNVDKFLSLLKKYQMYAIARPGPYICSEWDGGGLPAWVCAKEGKIRDNDLEYLAYVEKWYSQIIPIIAKHQYDNGGSIIMVQLENELDFFDCADVKGYISYLRDSALNKGVTVPLFCCSGQGSVQNSGGLVQGIIPTYNFYPSLEDRNFDTNCYEYGAWLNKNKLPLFVSETGREHSLLKRELLGGAKMLGAYNQVAGSNFEYNQSVNNWGKEQIESIITTRYDFGSMITTLGDFNREVDDGILFSQMINCYGDALASAFSVDLDYEVECDFISPYRNNALKLCENGYLIGVVNCGNTDGKAMVKIDGYQFSLPMKKQSAKMLPMYLKLDKVVIVYSNMELLSSQNRPIFVGDYLPEILVQKNGNLRLITSQDSAIEFGIEIVSKEKAVQNYKDIVNFITPYADEHSFINIHKVKIDNFANASEFSKVTNDMSMEKNSRFKGGLEYFVVADKNKKLFISSVSDFVTTYIDNNFIDCKLAFNQSMIVSESESGKYLFRVEKWGHSNFDDSRKNSMRIQSKKGIDGIYSIEKIQNIEIFQFCQYDSWLTKSLIFDRNEYDTRLSVNAWNSTRLPLIGVYYKKIKLQKGFDKLFFVLENGDAECALYINGNLKEKIHIFNKTIDLTKYLGYDIIELAILVRKKDWGERVGDIKLYYVNKVKVKIRDFGEKQMLDCKLLSPVDSTMPVTIAKGEIKIVEVDLSSYPSSCCYACCEGEDYKLTAVIDNKVIARMVAPGFGGISQQGGSDTQFYIPSVYRTDNKLKLIVESIGLNTRLNIKLEYSKN